MSEHCTCGTGSTQRTSSCPWRQSPPPTTLTTARSAKSPRRASRAWRRPQPPSQPPLRRRRTPLQPLLPRLLLAVPLPGVERLLLLQGQAAQRRARQRRRPRPPSLARPDRRAAFDRVPVALTQYIAQWDDGGKRVLSHAEHAHQACVNSFARMIVHWRRCSPRPIEGKCGERAKSTAARARTMHPFRLRFERKTPTVKMRTSLQSPSSLASPRFQYSF